MIFNEDLTVLLGTGFCTSACNDGCDLQVSSLRLLESCIASLRKCWKWRTVWIHSSPFFSRLSESFIDFFL